MIKSKFKKYFPLSLVAISLLTLIPLKANAAWKQDNIGWCYSEGDSYATGWKLIEGKWYYFYSTGYMAHDTTIDNYKLDSNGAWITSTSTNSDSSVSWKQNANKDWYYTDNSGTVLKNNWLRLKEFPGRVFYIDNDGILAAIIKENYYINPTNHQKVKTPDDCSIKVNQLTIDIISSNANIDYLEYPELTPNNNTIKLKATLNGKEINNVNWTVDTKNSASIDSNGVLTMNTNFRGMGLANVIATAQDETGKKVTGVLHFSVDSSV